MFFLLKAGVLMKMKGVVLIIDDIKENGFFLPLFRVIVVVLLDLKIDSFCFLSYAAAIGGVAGGGIFGGVFGHYCAARGGAFLGSTALWHWGGGICGGLASAGVF